MFGQDTGVAVQIDRVSIMAAAARDEIGGLLVGQLELAFYKLEQPIRLLSVLSAVYQTGMDQSAAVARRNAPSSGSPAASALPEALNILLSFSHIISAVAQQWFMV